MKSWEAHSCSCGAALINPCGMPNLGTVWAQSYDELEKAIFRNEQPDHDVYIYKNGHKETIAGKCSK